MGLSNSKPENLTEDQMARIAYLTKRKAEVEAKAIAKNQRVHHPDWREDQTGVQQFQNLFGDDDRGLLYYTAMRDGSMRGLQLGTIASPVWGRYKGAKGYFLAYRMGQCVAVVASAAAVTHVGWQFIKLQTKTTEDIREEADKMRTSVDVITCEKLANMTFQSAGLLCTPLILGGIAYKHLARGGLPQFLVPGVIIPVNCLYFLGVGICGTLSSALSYPLCSMNGWDTHDAEMRLLAEKQTEAAAFDAFKAQRQGLNVLEERGIALDDETTPVLSVGSRVQGLSDAVGNDER